MLLQRTGAAASTPAWDEVVTKPISQANLRDIILQAVRPANPSTA